MALTSAHQILTTINILNPLEKEESKKRHPKNEFQAYAYRLAHDLNDLSNLQIYMRLAKNVERSLMERAYSFVSDSSSNEKGRLFLWKLKILRQDLQRKKNAVNFDYDFVVTKMSKTRDGLSEVICERSEQEYSEKYTKVFHELAAEIIEKNHYTKREKPSILVIGYCSPKLLADLRNAGFKTIGIEISKKLTRVAKSSTKDLALKAKWICKDVVKNSFEDNCFDVILLNNYWSLVPLNSELTFLKSLKKVLKKDGKLVIKAKVSKEEKQEWKILKHKGVELECFVKESTQEDIQNKVTTLFQDVDFLK